MNTYERDRITEALDMVRRIADASAGETGAQLDGVACVLRQALGETAMQAIEEFSRPRAAATRGIVCPRCLLRVGALLPHRDGQGPSCATCLDESTPRNAAKDPASHGARYERALQEDRP